MAALDEIYDEIDRLTEPTEQLVDRVEIIPITALPIVAGMLLLILGAGLRASRWGVIP